ncbi:MAG: S4 domain-containing protein, partial [Pseudomonadota bacterium]|nr:S4 domain-containing protein [Pseudomonadota bacterium]
MAECEIITGTLATSGRLDKALAEASGLSRERVKGLIASGAVEVGGNIITSGSAKIAA